MKNDSLEKIKTNVASFLFLAWFIISLGLMIFFSEKDDGTLVTIIAGQYFLVFGLIGVKTKIDEFKLTKTLNSDDIMLLAFPILGIGLIVIPIIYKLTGEEWILPFAIASVFPIMGLLSMFKYIIEMIILKSKHYEYIDGQVFKTEKKGIGYEISIKYAFNGKEYKYKIKDQGKPDYYEGDYVPLYVNKNKPKDVRIDMEKTNIIGIVLSSAFVLAGIALLVYIAISY